MGPRDDGEQDKGRSSRHFSAGGDAAMTPESPAPPAPPGFGTKVSLTGLGRILSRSALRASQWTNPSSHPSAAGPFHPHGDPRAPPSLKPRVFSVTDSC